MINCNFQKHIYRHLCSVLPKYSNILGLPAHTDVVYQSITYNNTQDPHTVNISFSNNLTEIWRNNKVLYSIYDTIIYTNILSIEPQQNLIDIKIIISGLGLIGVDNNYNNDVIINNVNDAYNYYNNIYSIKEVINHQTFILRLKDGIFVSPQPLENMGRIEYYFDNGFNGVQEMIFTTDLTQMSFQAPALNTGWYVDFSKTKIVRCTNYFNTVAVNIPNQNETYFVLSPSPNFLIPSKDSRSMASDVGYFYPAIDRTSIISQTVNYNLTLVLKKSDVVRSELDNIVNLNFLMQQKIGGLVIPIESSLRTLQTSLLVVDTLSLNTTDLKDHYICITNLSFVYTVVSTDFLYKNPSFAGIIKNINVKSNNNNFSIDI